MKKLLLILSVVLISSQCYAGIITYDDVISPDDVTIVWLNGQKNTVYQAVNGNLDSNNILDDSLEEADFADAINPRVRTDEIMGDFTVTGHQPATSVNLTSDISAGTSYMNGFRLTTSATSKTYTASKDTWVYIDQNGAFQYVEVANDAAQPTTPANSLLLATVVTDADNITGVTDLRDLAPPGLRIYVLYRSGLLVEYDTAAQLTVGVGEIELGVSDKRRQNLTPTTVTWADLDTGAEAASTFYYVWGYADPDNASNIAYAISTSSSDATGVTNERLVGWFYNGAGSDISADAIGSYKGDGSADVNNSMGISQTEAAGGTNIAMAATTLSDIYTAKFFSSGRPLFITYGANGKSSASVQTLSAVLTIDSTSIFESEIHANYDNTYRAGPSGSYYHEIGAGPHTITFNLFNYKDSSSQTGTITEWFLNIEEL